MRDRPVDRPVRDRVVADDVHRELGGAGGVGDADRAVAAERCHREGSRRDAGRHVQRRRRGLRRAGCPGRDRRGRGGAARGDAQGDRGDAGARQPADAVHREGDPAARAHRQVAVDAGVVEADRVHGHEAGAPGQGRRRADRRCGARGLDGDLADPRERRRGGVGTGEGHRVGPGSHQSPGVVAQVPAGAERHGRRRGAGHRPDHGPPADLADLQAPALVAGHAGDRGDARAAAVDRTGRLRARVEQSGAEVRRRQRADRRQLRVEVRARARRVAGVPVSRDDVERDLSAGGIPRRPAALRGEDRGPVRVAVRQPELPGHHPRDRVDHDRRRGDLVEVADRRHRERVDVEATGVRTDDGAVHAAVPALPEPAEPVDQEVVADVRPVVPLDVVGVDRPQDLRDRRRGVAVGAGGVVHEAGADRGVVRRRGAADRLVGTPLRPGEDRRLAGGGLGRLHRPAGTHLVIGVRAAGVDQVDPQAARQRAAADVDPHLVAVGVADPQRLGAGPGGPGLAGARGGRRVQRRPAGPAGVAVGADQHGEVGRLRLSPPGDAEQVEGGHPGPGHQHLGSAGCGTAGGGRGVGAGLERDPGAAPQRLAGDRVERDPAQGVRPELRRDRVRRSVREADHRQGDDAQRDENAEQDSRRSGAHAGPLCSCDGARVTGVASGVPAPVSSPSTSGRGVLTISACAQSDILPGRDPASRVRSLVR